MAKKQGQQDNGLQNRRMRQYKGQKQGQQDNGLQNRRMRQYNGQKTGTTTQWFTK